MAPVSARISFLRLSARLFGRGILGEEHALQIGQGKE